MRSTRSSRRDFLLAMSALAAGAVRGDDDRKSLTGHDHSGAREVPRVWRPPSANEALQQRFVSPLRLPGPDGLFAAARPEGGLILEAQVRRISLLPGRTTSFMCYSANVAGKQLLNPLLVARKGRPIEVTLANRLGEDTTIHWHGLTVDERNDGSGMQPVRANESYLYRFEVRNRAGLYWYHPHPHDRTGAQVHLGMGSALLVEDDQDDALRRELGLVLGETEIPLIVQDKQIDDLNRIKYAMGEDDWIGNRTLVNWTPEPHWKAKTCLHRFRILNASNARTYLLAFTAGGRKLPFTLIGTDAGLLERSQAITEVFLSPAQRVDVLVDFEKLLAGTSVMMTSLKHDPMENDGNAVDPAMEHPGAPPLGEAIDLMRIDLTVPVCAPRKIPASLGAMPAMPVVTAPARKFRLHMDGPKWLISGYNFHDDMRAVRVRVKRGAREHWDITNDMKSMPHPMHLHGFQFRVVSRRGSPAQLRRMAVTPGGLTAQDLGWLDTVLVWPGETVRIAIDFSQPFTGTQRYMFHCHNLEHEDQGMMLNFAVEA